jgi:hypothetical protein
MPNEYVLEDCTVQLGDFRKGGTGWPERRVLWLPKLSEAELKE